MTRRRSDREAGRRQDCDGGLVHRRDAGAGLSAAGAGAGVRGAAQPRRQVRRARPRAGARPPRLPRHRLPRVHAPVRTHAHAHSRDTFVTCTST